MSLVDFFNANPDANIEVTLTEEVITEFKDRIIPQGSVTRIIFFENEFFALIPGTNLYTSLKENQFTIKE